MLDLITRTEWGARYADGFRDRPMPFTEFWLHHSVTIAPDLVPPFDDDDAAVRKLEEIGQARFGGGISYNQPVTPVGRCYVGVSPHRQGAHTKGHNTEGFAFVLVGNHTSKPPTANQEEVIARRMVELHRDGRSTRHTLNGGHRDADGNSTDCPGDAAEARVDDINRRADVLWDEGYPLTPATIPGTSLPLLGLDGILWGHDVFALGTVLKARGYQVVPRYTVATDLVKAIQTDLNRAGIRDRDGKVLVVDGKGFGSNARGRYPSSGWTRTISALQIGHGVDPADADGYFSAGFSSEVKRIQNDINLGGIKDSPLYTG